MSFDKVDCCVFLFQILELHSSCSSNETLTSQGLCRGPAINQSTTLSQAKSLSFPAPLGARGMIERLPRSFLSADLAVVLVGRAALACPSRTCLNRPSTLPRRDDDGPKGRRGVRDFHPRDFGMAFSFKLRPNSPLSPHSRRRKRSTQPILVVVVGYRRRELTHVDDVGRRFKKLVRFGDRNWVRRRYLSCFRQQRFRKSEDGSGLWFSARGRRR